MVLTAPINVAISAAVGATWAWAGREPLSGEPWPRSAALWSLLVFELIVYLPAAGLMMVRFPDWSVMYLLEPADLQTASAITGACNLLGALIAFFLARAFIRRRQAATALGVLACSLALGAAMGAFGYQRLANLGTTLAYHNDPDQLLFLLDSDAIYLLAPVAILTTLSWLLSLWRLRRYSLAWLRQPPVEN